MDVLRPPIIRIGNRRYRKNVALHDPCQDEMRPYEEENIQDYESDPYEDEYCDTTESIEKTRDGFMASLNISSVFFKFIIGKKQETKRRIESDTRTTISIPRPGVEGPIVISGVDKSLFQNRDKLHLTLGTLVLTSEAEEQRANALLQTCVEQVVRPVLGDDQLSCHVRGLEYMNDDPGCVDVLYAGMQSVDGSDSLQAISDQIVERFTSEELMQKQYDRVKLHITLMNTLFRRDRDGSGSAGGGENVRRPRESFDASHILSTHKEYNFGVHHVSTIHISRRHTQGPDGYYQATAKVSL